MTDFRRRLAEIEQRANAATHGPWSDQHESWAGKGAVLNGVGHPIAICGEDTPETGYYQATNDRAFIAHAREDVPWLIDQVKQLAGMKILNAIDALTDDEAAVARVTELHQPDPLDPVRERPTALVFQTQLRGSIRAALRDYPETLAHFEATWAANDERDRS